MIADVAMRKHGGRNQRRVGDATAVMHLIASLIRRNRDRIFNDSLVLRITLNARSHHRTRRWLRPPCLSHRYIAIDFFPTRRHLSMKQPRG